MAKIVTISIDEKTEIFLKSNPERSPSKIFRSAILRLRNPELFAETELVDNQEKLVLKVQRLAQENMRLYQELEMWKVRRAVTYVK